MIGYGRRSAIRVTELLVRTALAHFDETQGGENRDHFTRTERGNAAHAGLRDVERLRADELGLEIRIAVLEQHVHDFAEVGVELVERLAL